MPIIKCEIAEWISQCESFANFANLEINYIRFKSFRFSNLGIGGDTRLI